MCLACEEDALWRRYQLSVAVADNVMPPGFTAEDFEAFGLPVPTGRADAAAVDPDGSIATSGPVRR